jgi:hypothetical protein
MSIPSSSTTSAPRLVVASQHNRKLIRRKPLKHDKVIASIQNFVGYDGDREEIIDYLEKSYKNCFEKLQEQIILAPAGLTRDKFVESSSGKKVNSFIDGLARQMIKFVFDCELLVCGFDSNKRPYIFRLCPPGVVTDFTTNGSWAIGTGSAMAFSHLIFNGHERKHGAARTLYDCFDAKAHGEMDANVGFDWDAALIWGGGVYPVTKHIIRLMDSVWFRFARSPFEWDRRRADDPDDPPNDWENLLRECVEASLKEREPQIPDVWRHED